MFNFTIEAIIYAGSDEAYRGAYTILDMLINGSKDEKNQILFRHFDLKAIQLLQNLDDSKQLKIVVLKILREMLSASDFMPTAAVDNSSSNSRT